MPLRCGGRVARGIRYPRSKPRVGPLQRRQRLKWTRLRQLRLPAAAPDRKTRVLLADVGTGEQIGLLVDEVHQVWRLAIDEIEPSNVLGGEQPAHIAGIARPQGAKGSILILLDLRPILESP